MSLMVVRYGTSEARVKVVAHDGSGNSGEDVSDGDFELYDPMAVAGKTAVPERVVIAAVKPNPITGHGTVHFGLPADGSIKITLYDVSGRRVATICDASYAAGYHSVSFDTGGHLQSGIYLVTLRQGSEVRTQKVVISR